MLNWSQNKKAFTKMSGERSAGKEAINKCAGTKLAAALTDGGGGGCWASLKMFISLSLFFFKFSSFVGLHEKPHSSLQADGLYLYVKTDFPYPSSYRLSIARQLEMRSLIN